MSGRPRVVDSGSGTKPSVLIVDDHPAIRDGVAAVLAKDFEIAGLAADGCEALDAARELSPDVIVLDINMPRMGGFETMQALTARGSQAPVVFLSMLDDEDTVVEAFRRGGRGYVVKSRAARDLVSALAHVRDGRLFVPSLMSSFRLADGPGPRHALQLHASESSFVDGIAAVFDVALRRGDATCAIVTSAAREGLRDRLRDRGWDVGGRSGHDRCLVVDSAGALDRFMRNGDPDESVLAEIVAELEQYRLAVTGSSTGRLTIAGNLAGLLNADGHGHAAIAVERLWNALTQALPFFTVCGYDAAGCRDDATHSWSQACAQHWAVSPATGY
jgi:DNA-binding NarL/FixJ family response regulator